MESLEQFTQRAYLATAAVWSDSQVMDSPSLAYVSSAGSPERWSNAVVRCLYGPKDFFKIKTLSEEFDRRAINFNWHLWPSSHPELYTFLTNEIGLVNIGQGLAITKHLSTDDTEAESSPTEIVPLNAQLLDQYVEAKIIGWPTPATLRPQIREAAQKFLANAQNETFVLCRIKKVVAALSAYTENEKGYLRGSFVIPEFRGQGLFGQLLRHCEKTLARKSIALLVGIANQDTSAAACLKNQYKVFGEISVLARKKSPWLSL